ncbi:2-oxo acid dehydrogenase subunit E2 [Actinomadura gamaensis]|uniref:Dihydrolipoamide acetyltransferase component of pyruvate dehydrogenase complex n=1 Tax=Actinomadura gamaensis TaxID=1763541 RepID=A0ABV9TSW0_9ACTN
MPEFRMPSLGADMDEGTLTQWLVHPGDEVHRGDVVAVVETAKADIEVECFADGTVDRLLVEPGATVPVGTPLAVIGAGGRTAPPEPAAAPAEPARPAVPEPAQAPAPEPAPQPTPEPAPQPVHVPSAPVATPLVRRLATDLGVDLAAVKGSGHDGRVVRADVERAARRTRPAGRPAARPVAAVPERPAEHPAEHPAGRPAEHPAGRPAGRPGRRRVTPLARRLAGERGIDLATVVGTGAHDTVLAADVRHAAAPAAEASAPSGKASAPSGKASAPVGKPSALSGKASAPTAGPSATVAGGRGPDRKAAMRLAIGRSMARSKREIPHYYLSTTIDMGPALDWLREHNRGVPVSRRLVPAALLLCASARAAREVPELNGHWIDDAFVPGEGVHLGVTVALREGGLTTPVLRDAAGLPPEDVMSRLKDLVRRARTGRLRGSEMDGATLTVTDLGDQGVESVTGVIHPPQVALLGFGAVRERPWAVDGLLGVRPLVTATLSGDHRASDGRTGARLLTALDRLLRHPEEL